MSILVVVGGILTVPATALEILTEEDFVTGVVVEKQLVRLADNAIFLLDTSSSMNNDFGNTGKSKHEVAIAEFKKRNAYFPEIGHKIGIYEYTPWKEIYPVQTFDRDKVAAALDTVSERGSGPTPLASGIEKAEKVISSLSGRTALFLFYDGDYSGPDANADIWRLVKENDVCLIMITSATEAETARLKTNVARVNACSRVIPYDHFVNRPEYTTHVLYDVSATEKLVTSTEERTVVKVNNILFGFDKTELSAQEKKELDALGQFMKKNPDSYAVLAGYTDNVGIEDYNEHLSQIRTEMVAQYLADKHGIDDSRMVLHWHGSDNPVASNSTDEGRTQNRRVEVAVGGV